MLGAPNSCGYFSSLKHWGVKKCGFLGPDCQNFCVLAFTPSHGMGFFHFDGPVGQLGDAVPLFWGAEFIYPAISHH